MQALPARPAETGLIGCCECGTPIPPNPANMCIACLRSRVDITEGIPKQSNLLQCKFCERYLIPPSSWNAAALESKELLSICLKRIKPQMNSVRLVDANFIWTEPHSKRVRIKLTVQKEVFTNAVLQQSFIIEYVVCGQVCEDCHRIQAKDYWRGCLQIRQKCEFKKTLFYLEQLLLNPKAMVEFYVLEVDYVNNLKRSKGHGHVSNKHQLADLFVCRANEVGQPDAHQYSTRSHLGKLLKPGDVVLGFDLLNTNVNNAVFEDIPVDKRPDCILVRKCYDRETRNRKRNWKLRRLIDQGDSASVENEFQRFMEDLEEDEHLREKVNLYRDPAKARVPQSEADDEDLPDGTRLEDLLEELDINDVEMKEE